MLFDVERTSVAGRPALTVRGELDLATAPKLAATFDEELAAGPAALVVDLSPTIFMDSSGARTLVMVARRAQDAGVALHVVCPRRNSAVRLTIDLLEIAALVPIVDSAGEIAPGLTRHDGRP